MQTGVIATTGVPVQGRYFVNEVFYSLQGEGVMTGTAMTFVRFGRCNLRCTVANAGFDCDTEFESGTWVTLGEILAWVAEASSPPGWVLFTGGEPALQMTPDLVHEFKLSGYKLAIETNGTVKLPEGLDWVCVSPKSAEHTIVQRVADEVKYVRNTGQGIPKPVVEAKHKSISPAFDPGGVLRPEVLAHCIRLVKEHPDWRLSHQNHKLWGVR